MFINNRACQYCLVGLVSFSYLIVSGSTQAQPVTSDGSLSTQVQTSDNLNFNITGGSKVGDNLFHSFENFSVPENGSASFVNGDVNNIINRVTGRSISKIDGLIKANGDANLFLINPNGIIFGRNASLNIGGSFLATTADGIQFADGTFFSATDFQTQPILTVSVPMGLQFGETPGSIRNQSQATRFFPDPDSGKYIPVPVGLEVQPGKTLALVGGEIFLERGIVSAPDGEGRIELGSVDSLSFVSLTNIEERLALGYEEVSSFQDIQLTQNARIDGSGQTSGDIHVRGRKIVIANNSEISNFNLGVNEGGIIDIEATESVELNNQITIVNQTLNVGSTGNISIITERLILSSGSSIDSRTETEGKGDDVTINASKSVEIDGNGLLTQITSQSFGRGGNAGNIKITTGKLFLRDGGQITSSTFAAGKAGDVIIDAAEFIEISGQGKNFSGELVSSALLSQTSGKIFSANTGNGGTIEINTGRLNVQDRGKISVGAVNGSEGKAGTLNINALDSVNISGSDSILLAESESSKSAGDLMINTDRLTIANQGQVSVSATGTGEAGSLKINAKDINLNNGILIAETKAGDQGNITLSNLDTLLLRNNSQITTNATREATGGDININSNTIALLNNSSITANAVQGRGGNITITTQGLFQEPDSKIEATSEENIDGTIIINNSDIDRTSGFVELPNVPIDAETILAQNLCKFEDDKIAKGSSFIITGRGGLTPTSEESLGNVNNVVGWASRDDLEVSHDGLVGVRQRSKNETSKTNYPVIQQSQGWVTTADGSVWLVADAPQTILQNSQITHPDCRTLP
ncbi:MAG: filamentous hemagglutinin N-terminal domain-containing protein [Xenococcus sp. (in: cyanobacteria)]